jgi:hypothetical protein
MRKRMKKIFTFTLSGVAIAGIIPAAIVTTINPGLVASDHLIGHRG